MCSTAADRKCLKLTTTSTQSVVPRQSTSSIVTRMVNAHGSIPLLLLQILLSATLIDASRRHWTSYNSETQHALRHHRGKRRTGKTSSLHSMVCSMQQTTSRHNDMALYVPRHSQIPICDPSRHSFCSSLESSCIVWYHYATLQQHSFGLLGWIELRKTIGHTSDTKDEPRLWGMFPLVNRDRVLRGTPGSCYFSLTWPIVFSHRVA